MPHDWTSRSRRERRSYRREDSDTRGSEPSSHQDPRNPQHEGHARSRTNRDGYSPGSETYPPGSDDQDEYDRGTSRNGDDEFSESDTTRRPSEWGMIPYRDPTIRTSPSVASDSTLVLEAPALDTKPPSSRRRHYRSRSRDYWYADYDSEDVSNTSGPFSAERRYTPSSERHSRRTSTSSHQSSQGYQHAPSTRNRQREEDHPYRAVHYYVDEECPYYSDEEPQKSSSGTTQFKIRSASSLKSVEYQSPSRELPGGSITCNFKSIRLR